MPSKPLTGASVRFGRAACQLHPNELIYPVTCFGVAPIAVMVAWQRQRSRCTITQSVRRKCEWAALPPVSSQPPKGWERARCLHDRIWKIRWFVGPVVLGATLTGRLPARTDVVSYPTSSQAALVIRNAGRVAASVRARSESWPMD
jgi:hypothetical protein